MADKTINELTAASTMTDDDLLVLQQNGIAKKLSGRSLGSYVSSAAETKVNELNTAIDNKISEVQQAIDDAETDINSIVTVVQNMTDLGTDTTLTTSGMAADAKATGDAISDLKGAINVTEQSLNYLYVTDNANATGVGVTAKEQNGQIIIYGTPTGGRTFNFFNGAGNVLTSSATPNYSLPKGTYTFSVSLTNTSLQGLVYTTTTFSNARSIRDGNTITFDSDVAIGVLYNASATFGTIDNPTVITVSAIRTELISITDDENLLPTGDTTDRTSEIWLKLKRNGKCKLFEGDYYIKTLRMPKNSTLTGIKNSTHLILDSSATTYAIRMNDGCTVENVDIDGGLTELPSELGTRRGIQCDIESLDNYEISNCTIHGFAESGIALYEQGQAVKSGIITECVIYNCYYGIFVKANTEYLVISDCLIYKNYFGILNRGGNNKITNCGLDSNIVNCQIDADDGTNNGHGNIIGCTLNHSNNNANNGYSLIIKGTGRMNVIGCQFHYGKVRLQGTNGNVIDGCNFGHTTGIEIDGGQCSTFTNCFFISSEESPTTITNNTTVKFENCYTRAGEIFNPIGPPIATNAQIDGLYS